MTKRYETRAEIEAQGDGYNTGLEVAAKIAEGWAPFVQKKYDENEIGQAELKANQAAAIVIANKIRQQKTA